MSAGEFFDLIRPAAIFLAALVSTWVFASARRRFNTYVALAWAAGTLFLPLIVFPLYLALLLLWRRPISSPRLKYSLPLIYALSILTVLCLYFYHDYQSVDAHLARATQARLIYDRGKTISELQRALELEENPHIHKLLAIEFSEAGYWSEAISEYRLAEAGGEPDDSIHFQLGVLFERINQLGQAQLEYKQFVTSQACSTQNRLCDSARQRLLAIASQ